MCIKTGSKKYDGVSYIHIGSVSGGAIPANYVLAGNALSDLGDEGYINMWRRSVEYFDRAIAVIGENTGQYPEEYTAALRGKAHACRMLGREEEADGLEKLADGETGAAGGKHLRQWGDSGNSFEKELQRADREEDPSHALEILNTAVDRIGAYAKEAREKDTSQT